MSIGNHIRQLRLQQGMTQEQLAEKLHVTRQAVSGYESGRTRPDIDTLQRLCEIFATDLDSLVYGRTRELKAARRLKTAALVLGGLLVALTAISSALFWSAHRFFPLPGGPAAQAETYSRLSAAWETADAILLIVAFWGFLALLVLRLAGKCRLPFPQLIGYGAVLAAAMLVVSLPFALTDALFPPINYLVTPIVALGRMVWFWLIAVVVELLQRRRRSKA